MQQEISMENKAETPADRVVKKFGSQAELAKALGHKNKSTVNYWVKKGYIPLHNMDSVIAAGEKLGIKLITKDFAVPI